MSALHPFLTRTIKDGEPIEWHELQRGDLFRGRYGRWIWYGVVDTKALDTHGREMTYIWFGNTAAQAVANVNEGSFSPSYEAHDGTGWRELTLLEREIYQGRVRSALHPFLLKKRINRCQGCGRLDALTWGMLDTSGDEWEWHVHCRFCDWSGREIYLEKYIDHSNAFRDKFWTFWSDYCPQCRGGLNYSDYQLTEGDNLRYTVDCRRCGWAGYEWYHLVYQRTIGPGPSRSAAIHPWQFQKIQVKEPRALAELRNVHETGYRVVYETGMTSMDAVKSVIVLLERDVERYYSVRRYFVGPHGVWWAAVECDTNQFAVADKCFWRLVKESKERRYGTMEEEEYGARGFTRTFKPRGMRNVRRAEHAEELRAELERQGFEGTITRDPRTGAGYIVSWHPKKREFASGDCICGMSGCNCGGDMKCRCGAGINPLDVLVEMKRGGLRLGTHLFVASDKEDGN